MIMGLTLNVQNIRNYLDEFEHAVRLTEHLSQTPQVSVTQLRQAADRLFHLKEVMVAELDLACKIVKSEAARYHNKE